MTSSLDEIVANIDRGRAVIKAATSTMKALDSCAAAIEDAVAVKGDVATAVQLWRHADGQALLVIDSLDRRRAELSVWTPLASAVGSAGWIEEARIEFRHAIDKRPVDYVVAHYLGNIYLRRSEFDKAAEWFNKSAKYSRPKEPRHAAVALMHQALAYMLRTTTEDADNCRQAIACLDEVLALDPANLEATFQRAQYLARISEPRQALLALEEVIDRDGRYLVRVLMESDFQSMSEQIADLVYWLTRSYSKTVEKQLRLLVPFIQQVEEGIPIDGTETIVDPFTGDEAAEVFIQAVTLATSLYAQGDFHSMQQAQVLLLALDGLERRTVRDTHLWVEWPKVDRYGVVIGKYGGYRDVTYSFYGVSGHLV